jgi:hypothetical protein
MTSGTRALRVARRLYAAALYVWPRRARDRHGNDMRATFDALARDASARSAWALVQLASREIADVARTAPAARRSYVVSAFRLRFAGLFRELRRDSPKPWRRRSGGPEQRALCNAK